ncbi:hypothetical protein VTI74DRAFT_10788 [Chaetomium olivicolor]
MTNQSQQRRERCSATAARAGRSRNPDFRSRITYVGSCQDDFTPSYPSPHINLTSAMTNASTQQALNDALMARRSSASSTSSTSAAVIPGGGSGYEPWYPSNIPLNSSVKEFITHFFEVSDDPDRNDEWVGFFRDDATVIIGNDVAKGKEEIRKLRRRMWKEVEARKHRLVKVFPAHFSPDRSSVVSMHEAEFMLFGAVAYRMKDGKGDAVAGWAGHAQVRRDGLNSPWKFDFYRVYIQR